MLNRTKLNSSFEQRWTQVNLAVWKLCDLGLLGIVRIENGDLIRLEKADGRVPMVLNDSWAGDFPSCAYINAHSSLPCAFPLDSRADSVVKFSRSDFVGRL